MYGACAVSHVLSTATNAGCPATLTQSFRLNYTGPSSQASSTASFIFLSRSFSSLVHLP